MWLNHLSLSIKKLYLKMKNEGEIEKLGKNYVSGILIKNLTTDVQKEYMFCEKTDSDQLFFLMSINDFNN